MATVPNLGLHSAHACVVISRPMRATVVRQKDDDGVVPQFFAVQKLREPSHVCVDVSNHAEVPS